MTLVYESPRPLASVAFSLVNACLKYFGTGEKLLSSMIEEDQKKATFIIAMPL
jgi:hypothetical protein